MKNTLLTFILVLLFSINSNATNWITSLENAKKLSIATNKMIVVDFWATWCGPCTKMDRETWSDEEISELMLNFIPVKIDLDANKSLARKYDVKGIPYVFILDPNGEIIYSSIGFKDKITLKKILEKYALNLAFMQNENTAFFKEKNAVTSLNLAEKNLDFTLYLKNTDVKSDFRKLANNYLSKTKKFLKKNKNNKDELLQKVNLLSLYIKTLRHQYKKTLDKLNAKFPENAINKNNKLLYDFLNFVCYRKLDDKENAKKWYEKLRANEDYTKYLKKVNKI